MSEDYYTITRDGVILHIRVKPNANKNRIKGFSEDKKFLLVEINAPPTKGMANKELERFLRKVFSKSAVIVSGFQAREKYVMIRGANIEEIKKTLEKIGICGISSDNP